MLCGLVRRNGYRRKGCHLFELRGDTLGLAAAKAVLEVYENENVIKTLWARGHQLHAGFNAHCKDLNLPVSFQGCPL